MTTLEVAKYLKYSKRFIDKMVVNNNHVEGVHYHQKSNKRILDREKIDL
ncbi:hypothetical protein [Poseidonibacter lekithochrous]|nr:hypothetical protein [Poseidonibacter lekithochrous]